MYKNTKEPVCIKCKGQSVVEVFEPEVGFEVLIPCPKCDKGNEDSLWRLLEGYAYQKCSPFKASER